MSAPKNLKNLNALLFDAIRQQAHSQSVNWKQEVQQLLGIGRTAMYNRINGTTPLLFEEAILLAQKYNISLDALIHERKVIIAQHSAQTFENHTEQKIQIIDYLELVVRQFTQIQAPQDMKFYYASNDLPIFYYALSPEVLAFKIFAWGIAMPHSEQQRQQKFLLQKFTCHNPEFELIQQALREYSCYPSIEIWPAKILENTLNQLEFYSRTHRFENPDDIPRIYDALEALIVKIFNEYIATGEKPIANNRCCNHDLTVYYNEIIQVNTILLISGTGLSKTYCVFDSPHFLVTEDPWLEKYTLLWFKYLISSSSQLSQSNMGLRNEVLEKFIRQIRQSKEKSIRSLT